MKRFSGVYVISDDPARLLRAVDDGATIVQLRDKTADAETIRAKAERIAAHPKRAGFLFFLNDDAALAMEVGADGVHIGQDTDTVQTRRIIGHALLGKTTHSLEQAQQAAQDGADYISAGPVYPTPTKPGRPAVGLEYVRAVVEWGQLPFVAIGGIDATNIDDVLAAGARVIGIVRADAQTILRKIHAHHP